MNIDMDRLAILIGRLVLQTEAAGQQVERLTKQMEDLKKEVPVSKASDE